MANHEEFKRIMGVVKTAEVIESGFQVFLNVRNLQRSSFLSDLPNRHLCNFIPFSDIFANYWKNNLFLGSSKD